MGTPHLRIVGPTPTSEEEQAISAAVAAVLDEWRAEQKSGAPRAASEWVHAARLRGRRTGMARGSWRLSGRVARRSRV